MGNIQYHLSKGLAQKRKYGGRLYSTKYVQTFKYLYASFLKDKID